MSAHDKIEELMALEALGELSSSDREDLARETASHGDGCATCRQIRIDYAEVAGRLAFSLEPMELPDGMVDRILATPAQADAETKSHRSWARSALLGAAAALLFLVGALSGSLLARNPAPPRELALSEFLSKPQTEVLHFTATGGGDFAVATHPDSDEVYVLGSDLVEPPKDQVLQLWTIEGKTAPVPGPTFSPTDGTVIEALSMQTAGVDVLAVTQEPAGGSKQPTSDPIYVAELS